MQRMQKIMEVRKLKKEEHIRTRKLWEEIFTEDTPDFLDYYYSFKTADNEIYVIEDQDEIVSMIHLNPYHMRIEDKIYPTHYIVAVATNPQYRRRGLMAKLLNYVLQEMQDRGEPFTFLMPASEAIYKPFGFEFVYTQGSSYVTGVSRKPISGTPCRVDANVNGDHSETAFILAKEADCEEIAEFANECLEEYDIATWRTEDYYKTILAEQISENGGILLAKRNGQLEGILCFANEGQLELREPLFTDERLLRRAVYHLTGNDTEEVLCVGYGNEEEKPLIMAKVLQPEFENIFKKAKVFLNEVV